jgi:uncharacterized protein (DUF2062 family)
MKDLIKRLLKIDDTPERTALAFSMGVFLGFSPFLGFHTVLGVAIAFLFRLNRVAVLLGVWSNTPWWIVPYYIAATGVGLWMTEFQIDRELFGRTLQLARDQGIIGSDLWAHLMSQGGLLLSFMIGSSILAAGLALVAYPFSLKWIKFYRSRRK